MRICSSQRPPEKVLPLPLYSLKEHYYRFFLIVVGMLLVAENTKLPETIMFLKSCLGLPRGLSSEEPACQCRQQRASGSTPGRGDALEEETAASAAFFPGESHGQKSQAGCSP